MARDADLDESEFILPRLYFQLLDGTETVGDILNNPHGRSPPSKRVSEEITKLLELYANPPRIDERGRSDVSPVMPIDY